MDYIELKQIKPSMNPIRPNLTGIGELAESIKQYGLLQPIVVKPREDFFEIVAGNRRYNACKTLGLRKIGCYVVELDDKRAYQVSLIENIQRKSMTSVEEAYAFKKYVSDFGWGGVSELASIIGKSPGYVTKRIKLLELPPDVLELVSSNSISTSVAQELFSAAGKDDQSELSKLITKRHLSLRNARELVHEFNKMTDDYPTFQTSPSRSTDDSERSFEKSVVALRIAMNRLGSIIDDISDNWLAGETLLRHKNMLHAQIDLLMKEKRKLKKIIHTC